MFLDLSADLESLFSSILPLALPLMQYNVDGRASVSLLNALLRFYLEYID